MKQFIEHFTFPLYLERKVAVVCHPRSPVPHFVGLTRSVSQPRQINVEDATKLMIKTLNKPTIGEHTTRTNQAL